MNFRSPIVERNKYSIPELRENNRDRKERIARQKEEGIKITKKDKKEQRKEHVSNLVQKAVDDMSDEVNEEMEQYKARVMANDIFKLGLTDPVQRGSFIISLSFLQLKSFI